MQTRNLVLLGILSLLIGCSTLRPAAEEAPLKSQLEQMPVVRFGTTPPAGKDFILYFPAKSAIPFKVLAQGSLFVAPSSSTHQVALSHDLYVHKQWISYDRKHWVNNSTAINAKIDIKIPGYDFPHPGLIRISMDAK